MTSPSPAPLRLLLVEDDEFTRTLLSRALRAENFEVVCESADASQALKKSRRLTLDVAILDLDLGRGPTGLDLALGLRRSLPNIGILFLTNYKDPRLLGLDATMAPHGSVYFEKGSLNNFSQLKKAVERAISNAKISHQRQNVEMKSLTKGIDLTSIQIKILKMVADGKTNEDIAAIRNVSEKSIEQVLSRITKKIGIEVDKGSNRRVELALFYYRQIGALKDETP